MLASYLLIFLFFLSHFSWYVGENNNNRKRWQDFQCDRLEGEGGRVPPGWGCGSVAEQVLCLGSIPITLQKKEAVTNRNPDLERETEPILYFLQTILHFKCTHNICEVLDLVIFSIFADLFGCHVKFPPFIF